MSIPARSPSEMRWSQETRLRAIDETVFWEGRVNRASLLRRFGISVPQATNDLRDYQARAPGNLRYDTREKAYIAEARFQPLFGVPSAEAWLAGDALVERGEMPIATLPRPMRMVDPWMVRRMVAARRDGLALRVMYQPMDLPEPTWRWIAPLAFGSDGLRWHLRAWNHDAARHEDLLFPRMLEVNGERPAGQVPVDADWHRLVPVRLRPAARLSPGQRGVIEADYGMVGGEVCLEVRAALLFLFLRRLGLDRVDGHVEVANMLDVEVVLAEIRTNFSSAA